jgi:hypothetical protein
MGVRQNSADRVLNGLSGEHMPHNAELLIAAILAAGMLPTLPAPLDAEDLTPDDRARITRLVGHAVSLYSAVMEGLRSVPPQSPEPRNRSKRNRRDH